MREKSPFFLVFLGGVIGGVLSHIVPTWVGLLVLIAGGLSVWLLKERTAEFLSVIVCGVVLLFSPAVLPNGKYFLTGRVSSFSSRAVRLSDVKFHQKGRWIRAEDTYVFLRSFGNGKKVDIHDIFSAYAESKSGRVVAEKYFAFSQNSPLDKIYAFGAKLSNFLYGEFKKYTFGEAQTISSLFIGKRTLTYTKMEMYRNGGYAHIFSVSGMHVGMITLFSLLFVSEFLPWNWAKYPFTAMVIVLYGFVTGLSIPTLRAVAMFLLFAFFKLIDRPQSLLNILGIVGTVEILMDPSVVFNVSFQLSYAAVVSIAILLPRLPVFRPKWLSDSLWLTVAANIGVMPFLILHYSKIYLASFIFNSTIVPLLVFVLMEGALLFSIFAFGGVVIAEKVIGGGIYVFSKLLDKVAYVTNKMPLSIVEVKPAKAFFLLSLLSVVALFLLIYFAEPADNPGINHKNSVDDP